ncbi:acyl carrier protein [Pseudonocardia sp. ICBG1142]|uniref:acyl carrier protein n=1 Tax=Pseudonocardia sp. ICBG1142 TaxID=2846760 RepID=UPI001CF705AB|nr:acyl carrier protein [Pseudonocardia sp. ICBG1142]
MTATSNTSPMRDVRKTVAELVQDEMDRAVDPDVDLFDQGITSLTFLRIIARTNETYGIALDVTQLYEASVATLSDLVAAHLSAETSATAEDRR